MLLSRLLALLAALSLLAAICCGNVPQLSLTILSGAEEAVQLMLRIGGALCLWSGLLEVMQRSGLSALLARLLRPLIGRLFGEDARDSQAQEALAQNLSANLLGLGSAATPAGLRAAKRLKEVSDREGRPPHGVFRLMILNTASLQLLPTTVAALRAGLGCETPFDILPAVWLSSLGSVAAGLLAARLLRGGRL